MILLRFICKTVDEGETGKVYLKLLTPPRPGKGARLPPVHETNTFVHKRTDVREAWQ